MGIPFQIILYGLCRITHAHTHAHTFERAHVKGKFATLRVCQFGKFVKLEPYQRQVQVNLISIFIKYRYIYINI